MDIILCCNVYSNKQFRFSSFLAAVTATLVLTLSCLKSLGKNRLGNNLHRGDFE